MGDTKTDWRKLRLRIRKALQPRPRGRAPEGMPREAKRALLLIMAFLLALVISAPIVEAWRARQAADPAERRTPRPIV
ncbi:MAG TPA: hypothetical protein QGH10_00145, partial [Armatimonadota bacterium]|nr:hypothetical protein [Armatimonadota bacterium]